MINEIELKNIKRFLNGLLIRTDLFIFKKSLLKKEENKNDI